MALVVKAGAVAGVRMRVTADWSAPTLAIFTPAGIAVAGGTAVLDAASTAVATAATVGWQLVLDSVAGLAVGRWYYVTTDGITAYVQITRIDATAVTVDIAPALSTLPADGDAFVGADVAVTLPAITTRGYGYTIVLTETVGGLSLETRAVFDVVRRPFLCDFGASDVRHLLARLWPTQTPITEIEIDNLVTLVRSEIRSGMLALGVYPHDYVDPDAFRALGNAVARRLLAREHDLFPRNAGDRGEYLRDADAEESRHMSRLVQSWQSTDADDDGAVDAVGPSVFAVWSVR